MNQSGRANDMDKLVAKRIRIARLLKGLSQQQVATALCISIQQVQKYEKGTNRISSGRLYQLAEFLQLPITYFFNQHDQYQLKIDANNSSIGAKDTIALINSFGLIRDATLKKHLLNVLALIARR